jgi:hypothetical protein
MTLYDTLSPEGKVIFNASMVLLAVVVIAFFIGFIALSL